jgi:1-acyl-sn-glycerol-3-phosphate acyltransferase
MDLNPLRVVARHTPQPLKGIAAMGGSMLGDTADLLRHGIPPGDDLDAWDPEYIRQTVPLTRAVFGTYFRGEVRGLENIPAEGPALLVGNHSGGTMIADTFVFTQSFYEHFGADRRFHQLAHSVAARMPLMGLIRHWGTVVASHDNARAAFKRDAPVLVYPGGDYETFRPTTHSDQIEFGGRKGFIKLALDEGVPIVPVVSIGGQETALFVTRGETAARMTGLAKLARIKVLPVSIGPPFGVNLLDLPGRLPLPAKITIQVMPPVDLTERFGPSPDPEDVYDELTGDMQGALDELSDERTLPLVG